MPFFWWSILKWKFQILGPSLENSLKYFLILWFSFISLGHLIPFFLFTTKLDKAFSIFQSLPPAEEMLRLRLLIFLLYTSRHSPFDTTCSLLLTIKFQNGSWYFLHSRWNFLILGLILSVFCYPGASVLLFFFFFPFPVESLVFSLVRSRLQSEFLSIIYCLPVN